jgi:hypothetical protein
MQGDFRKEVESIKDREAELRKKLIYEHKQENEVKPPRAERNKRPEVASSSYMEPSIGQTIEVDQSNRFPKIRESKEKISQSTRNLVRNGVVSHRKRGVNQSLMQIQPPKLGADELPEIQVSRQSMQESYSQQYSGRRQSRRTPQRSQLSEFVTIKKPKASAISRSLDPSQITNNNLKAEDDYVDDFI